jgi:hypothetical protein
MKSLLRCGRCAIVSAAALGLLGAWWKFCDSEVIPAKPHTMTWREVLAFHHRAECRAEVDRELRLSNARVNAKGRIGRDLIAGRLTVGQAAQQLADLPDTPPNFMAELRATEKGNSDQERLCWHVIDWACHLLADDPQRAMALRCRLEKELDAYLQTH